MSKNLTIVCFLSFVIVIISSDHANAQGLETSPILWIVVLGVPMAAIIVISLVVARARKVKLRIGLLAGIGIIFLWFGINYSWSLIQGLMQHRN